MLTANQSKFVDTQESLNELRRQQRELEQSKIQFRDERNAWSKQNYVAARVEQKLDYLEDKLSEIGNRHFEIHDIPQIDSNNDMMICLSDLHIGASYDSTFGLYNSDIAAERLKKYLQEIIKIQTIHNSEKAYVLLLGDIISGSIHKSIQITNRENVIDQIKIASEYIASFCFELSKYFKTVFISSVSGNHSRIDLKDDALKDERLDDLVAFILDKTLCNQDNIHMLSYRKLDTTIADISIRGNTYFIVHGDYDNPTESSLMRLCSMIGIFPEAIIMGHRHSPAFSEINNVKVVQSGCLGGSGDDYTIQKRLYGKPNQTVCICNDKGIECMYPIEL